MGEGYQKPAGNVLVESGVTDRSLSPFIAYST